MTCVRCKHQTCKRFGTYGKRRVQRWRCNSCKVTFCQQRGRCGRFNALPRLLDPQHGKTHRTQPQYGFEAARSGGASLPGTAPVTSHRADVLAQLEQVADGPVKIVRLQRAVIELGGVLALEQLDVEL